MSAKKEVIPKLSSDRPPLTDEDGEVRELTEEDFRQMRPMKEVFPEVVEAFERLRGERGPQKAPTKERIGLRLDKNIVEHFRASGQGWQSRINEILAKHIEKENS